MVPWVLRSLLQWRRTVNARRQKPLAIPRPIRGGAGGSGVCTWGDNTRGECGTGTSGNQYVSPVGVLNLSTVTWVDGGDEHAIFLLDDGSVWTVGYNASGQLGQGDTTDRTTPVQVTLPGTAQMVAAGQDFCVAVLDDGSAYAWGDNSRGQLGDGSTADSSSPVQVVGVGGSGFLSGLTNCGAGGFHSLFIGPVSGVVHTYAVGSNTSGQLGDGTTTDSSTPLDLGRIGAAGSIIRVTGGEEFSLALRSDGRLYAWGDNGFGQLGLGDTTDRSSPTQTATGVGFIGAGYYHAIYSKDSDGTLRTTGRNDTGQLGDGTTTDRNTWQNIGAPDGKSFTGVDGMFASSLARADDGTVYASGEGSAGQLGDGAGTDATTFGPVSVSGVSTIGAGANTGYALSDACLPSGLLWASAGIG